eukprot:GHVP01053626.1.p1 GENE.GHVP01053626.1~~GHVP01053626.1.p1  ORF type:complete len:383 (-),score=56.07 GHVP01053626.1:1052-2200(-)
MQDIEDLVMRGTNMNLEEENIYRITNLPEKYNFEINKTLECIRKNRSKTVALQLPEGLISFSLVISAILKRYTKHPLETIILSDVSYGACCVEDRVAELLGCDLLVHYGHSCLVPSTICRIQMLYVYVTIKVDIEKFVDIIENKYKKTDKICLISTVQFLNSINEVNKRLTKKGYDITIPRSRPLSKGEILGCTSPIVSDVSVAVYFGDGAFHATSFIIANPTLPLFCYSPYTETYEKVIYDCNKMIENRKKDIKSIMKGNSIGIVLSMLGRQGRENLLDDVIESINIMECKKVIILLSLITESSLKKIDWVDGWVEIGCPRLAVDWSSHFDKPIVTPYEIAVGCGRTILNDHYPMNYYEINNDSPWTVNYKNKIKAGTESK